MLTYITGERFHGATDDEIEVALGLIHQNASARRRSLELKGKIVKTDRARQTRHHRWAAVYRCQEFMNPEPYESPC